MAILHPVFYLVIFLTIYHISCVSAQKKSINQVTRSIEIKSTRCFWIIFHMKLATAKCNLLDEDNLSLKLIKSIKFDILDSLTLIINQSLVSGVFPDKLKLAKVIALCKKRDSTITDNYRPISLLPTLSKVLEKNVYNKLFSYFSEIELSIKPIRF